MKCPDCGDNLREVSLLGTDKSYRCFKCGGFWLDGSTVNGVDVSLLAKWTMPNRDGNWIGLGSGGCPVDGTKLATWRSESVPVHIIVKRCDRCGRWWFPDDNLLNYKPAQEAKVDYFKQWGVHVELADLWLPIAVITILLVGLIVSLQLVQERQQVAVPAYQTK